MKNTKLFTVVLLAIILFAPIFINAQVPTVPEPVSTGICFDENFNAMPCGSGVEVESAPTGQQFDIQESASELFNFLKANINKIINDLKEGYQNIYDGLRGFWGRISG